MESFGLCDKGPGQGLDEIYIRRKIFDSKTVYISPQSPHIQLSTVSFKYHLGSAKFSQKYVKRSGVIAPYNT